MKLYARTNMHHFPLSNCFAVQMCLSIMRIEIQVFVIILIDMQISLQLYEIISTDLYALIHTYTHTVNEMHCLNQLFENAHD